MKHHFYIKKAFTLAEVLITLGIIGVVAAMTMPSLIQHFQEKELTTAYLRIYSTLNQAYTFAQQEYGTFDMWEQTDADTYSKIRPFLNVANDCPVGVGIKDCFYNGKYYSLDKQELASNFVAAAGKSQPAVRLASGESILFYRKGHAVDFMVDLNGDKRPNRVGVDFHFLSFNTSKNKLKILPGPSWANGETHSDYCLKNTPNSWVQGSSCGYWILKYHNMDYLHLNDEVIKERWD